MVTKKEEQEKGKNKFSDRIKDSFEKTKNPTTQRGQAVAGHAGRLIIDPHLQPADVLKSSGAIAGHAAMMLAKPASSVLANAFKKAFEKKIGDANTPMATATNIVKKTMKN